MEALVSIIIPVYNAAAFLDECVGSILAQTYRDFELILVNDGSTDSSPAICRAYEASDPRVRVIDKPNGGVSSARNAALDVARGRWVVFCDADDYYFPDALKVLLDVISGGEDVDFGAASSVKLVDGRLYHLRDYPEAVVDSPVKAHRDYALWANIYKREIIEKYHIRFEEGISYSEDRIFMLEYLSRCRRMALTPRVVYAYRIHPASACRSGNVTAACVQQLQAAARIRQLADVMADAEMQAVARSESDFVVRMAVERAALERFNLKALRKLRDILTADARLRLPSGSPYWLFCLVARARGVRRKYFGRPQSALFRPDAESEF